MQRVGVGAVTLWGSGQAPKVIAEKGREAGPQLNTRQAPRSAGRVTGADLPAPPPEAGVGSNTDTAGNRSIPCHGEGRVPGGVSLAGCHEVHAQRGKLERTGPRGLAAQAMEEGGAGTGVWGPWQESSWGQCPPPGRLRSLVFASY